MQDTEFVHIVGKYLQSFKRSLIIGMDISTPDWEISVLDNTKIPENSEKSEFFVGVQKFQVLKIDLFFT